MQMNAKPSTPRSHTFNIPLSIGSAFKVGLWMNTFVFAYRNLAAYASFCGVYTSLLLGVPYGCLLTMRLRMAYALHEICKG